MDSMDRLNHLLNGIEAGSSNIFSFTTTNGTPELICIQKREEKAASVFVFETADGKLQIHLTVEKNPSHFCIRTRLNSIKSLDYTLSRIKIADVCFTAGEGDTALLSSTGGYNPWGATNFPPSMLKDTVRTINDGDKVRISSNLTGRSSDENLPIWILNIDNSGGVWFGPEWTGSWELQVSRSAAQVKIELELPTFDFSMIQGEELEMPPFIIGEYEGNLSAGSNSIRKAIMEDMTPQISGRRVEPQVVFQGFDGMELYQDEEYLVRESKRASEIGVEDFVFDAGWNHDLTLMDLPEIHGFTRINPWPKYLGQWIPSDKRFPSGMVKFAKHVRNHNMRFGLWCEPRVSAESEDYKYYKDILLTPNHEITSNLDNEYAIAVADNYLVDLGKKAGEDYFVDVVSRFVEEYKAEWLWFDFNTDPRSMYWNDIEEESRKGIAELRFYQGLNRVFERLMEKFPDLWIETCASGGRIIDFAMLKRSHSIWVSDFSAYECAGQSTDPDIARNFRSCLNKYLPASYIQNAIFIPQIQPRENIDMLLYDFLSHFAGDVQFGQGLMAWSDDEVKAMTYYVSKYKSYRKYLKKDYYHLVSTPQDKSGWDGWVFDDKTDDSGIMVLFRMEDCEEDSFQIPKYRDMDFSKYRVETVLGDPEINIANGRICVSLKKRGAALIYYGAH